VIIYLGTNDLADRYSLSGSDVAEACASLVPIVRSAECGRNGSTPPVLLVSPPPIRATGPDAAEYATVAAKSQGLGAYFAEAARAVGAELLDLDGVVRYSEDDPIHLDADAHQTLAEQLEPRVRELVR
jgi:lysophospholipase L1-like esterase